MKAELNEYDGCFEIALEAENMKDAATLVRFGLNSTKEIRSKLSSAHKDGTFTGYLVLGKKKNFTGMIE